MMTLRMDPWCPAAPDGQHFKLMTSVLGAHSQFRSRCERCGEFIRVQGAKWVSESVVIHEQTHPSDLLRS